MIFLEDDTGSSMSEVRIREGEEFIRLGQALKKAGLESSGVDAKYDIQDGLVKVNDQVETRRGRKLVPGDTFEYDGEKVTVIK